MEISQLSASRTSLYFSSSVALLFFFAGCAHKAVTVGADNPEQRLALLKMACKPSEKVVRVRGSVWLKAKSKEASGQFPATVLAESLKGSEKSHLKMEVTNLVGGVEASIEITGDEYVILSPKMKAPMKGKQSWGGIPLAWAHSLFMGKIPCAPSSEWESLKLESTGDRHLTVRRPGSKGSADEVFEYRFRKWGEEFWPENLILTRTSSGKDKKETRIEFKFDDPEEGTGAPKRWEAKSFERSPTGSTLGEVKVRWKDRSPEF